VRRLVIEAKGLHRRNHRPATATRNEQRLFSHLARQRARKRMSEQFENLLPIAREQRRTKSVQKRQHRGPVEFGVIYTL
jgi:hypothetical protein